MFFPSFRSSTCTLEDLFHQTYSNARSALILGEEEYQGISQHETFEHPSGGPSGERLYSDLFVQGDPHAQYVLIVLSGVHGVEGFVGSGIQQDLLRHLQVPKPFCVIHLHSVNPWGMAWVRRVNEEGVDLNRNFVDFSKPPANDKFGEFANWIVPSLKKAPELDFSKVDEKIAKWVEKEGLAVYLQSLTQGQYEYPNSLFYGGEKPSWSRHNIEKLVENFDLNNRQAVTIVDCHSGLGPFGYGEIICDHPVGSHGLELSQKMFGENVTSPSLGTSSSYHLNGLVDYYFHQALEKANYVTLEYGTYPSTQMIDALRKDHWLHRNYKNIADCSHCEAIKSEIKQVFYPDSKRWRESVILRSRQVVEMVFSYWISQMGED